MTWTTPFETKLSPSTTLFLFIHRKRRRGDENFLKLRPKRIGESDKDAASPANVQKQKIHGAGNEVIREELLSNIRGDSSAKRVRCFKE
jgi:hypothetical protein